MGELTAFASSVTGCSVIELASSSSAAEGNGKSIHCRWVGVVVSPYSHIATVVPALTGSCLISGKSSARIGTVRKYAATYTDADGNTVDGIESVWDVSAPSGVRVSADGGVCTIDIPLDSMLVGETIVVRVADKDGKYGSFEKKVQVITVG